MDDPIRDMVDNILSNKEAEALSNFETAVAVKLGDALDAKKQEIASGLGEESGLSDKFNKAAEFIGDLFTGEAGRKLADKMMKKDDKEKDKAPPPQQPTPKK